MEPKTGPHTSCFCSWNTLERRHTPLTVHIEETWPNGRLCRKLKSCSIYLDAACHMKELSIDSSSRWLGTTMQKLQCGVESESETSSASTHKFQLGNKSIFAPSYRAPVGQSRSNYSGAVEFQIVISQKALISSDGSATASRRFRLMRSF